ncbi:MAG: beta-N-acetylhexosaminidase [Gammaproteobacteria bacterium]
MRPGPLMLDLAGTTLADDERSLLQNPAVGGLILFSRNIVNPAQVRALVAEVRALRPQILIAVDQEGGRVQRLREGFVKLPPMRVFGEMWNRDREAAITAAADCGWLMAAEVLAMGIDISFAPVLDLDFGASAVIGDRSFHRDPLAVTALAGAFVHGMNAAGMQATGKHFPGHGYVAADSHHAIPVDDRELAALEADDLVPFRKLAQRLGGIMPAHVVYEKIDPQPAGFSRYWLQDVLRGQLGFDGVIFSDDLSMEGAAGVGSYPERARAALDAGCDMVLVCNRRAAALETLAYLEQRAGDAIATARIESLRGNFTAADPQRLVAARERIAPLNIGVVSKGPTVGDGATV